MALVTKPVRKKDPLGAAIPAAVLSEVKARRPLFDKPRDPFQFPEFWTIPANPTFSPDVRDAAPFCRAAVVWWVVEWFWGWCFAATDGKPPCPGKPGAVDPCSGRLARQGWYGPIKRVSAYGTDWYATTCR